MAFNEKRWETRSRRLTSHRGPLGIAASKEFPKDAQYLCNREPFKSAMARHGIQSFAELPLGKILGVTELVDVIETTMIGHEWERLVDRSASPAILDVCAACPPAMYEIHFGNYSDGRFFYLTRGMRALEKPIPARGMLGLWNYDLEAP
jgi:hypothetical protein